MRSLGLKLGILCIVALVVGFCAFVWFLPEEQIPLTQKADGIVVLTGGTSRVTDALELLASGRGKRLLITGVNPGTTTTDIAHQTGNYERLLACCVDLDYSALNTYGNAVQARRWVRTSEGLERRRWRRIARSCWPGHLRYCSWPCT